MGLCIIGVKDIQNYMTYKNAVLIDLRDEADFRLDHIPGAVNVPAGRLQNYMRQSDKDRIHIFYCQHGGLSFQAGRRYVKEGYRICSLAGGMDSYRQMW